MGEKIFNTDDLESGRLGAGSRRRRRREKDVKIEDAELDLSGIVEEENEISDGLADQAIPKEDEDDSISSQLHRPLNKEERRRMRITMLGVSGSGKTAFLSGVYQAMMLNEFHALQLTPSGDVDEAFQQIGEIGNIALLNQDNYDFPDGTLDTTIFPLALENGGEPVCDFDFTDYAGGDILNIFKASEEVTPGARALKAQLLASDAILIFADAYVLCKGKNIADWQKATGASYIAPLFSALVKAMDPDRAMTVLFVLTKTDDERIPVDMRANNFAKLTERMVRTFNSIHQKAQKHIPDGWNFGVIPVSAVGEGNYQIIDGRTVAREGCAPEPYNIDVTMVYTIACILSQWKRADNIKKEMLTEQMVEVGRGNTFVGNLFAGLQKVRRPEEKVAGLLNEIEDQDKGIRELERHIHVLVSRTGIRDIVQRRRDHLEDM